jgi:hypothetical protein
LRKEKIVNNRKKGWRLLDTKQNRLSLLRSAVYPIWGQPPSQSGNPFYVFIVTQRWGKGKRNFGGIHEK